MLDALIIATFCAAADRNQQKPTARRRVLVFVLKNYYFSFIHPSLHSLINSSLLLTSVSSENLMSFCGDPVFDFTKSCRRMIELEDKFCLGFQERSV